MVLTNSPGLGTHILPKNRLGKTIRKSWVIYFRWPTSTKNFETKGLKLSRTKTNIWNVILVSNTRNRQEDKAKLDGQKVPWSKSFNYFRSITQLDGEIDEE